MSNTAKDQINKRKRGIKEFLIGAAVAAAGGLATLASYNAAKPGETYTVYTGFIALGIVYAVIGAFHIAFPNAGKKSIDTTSSEKKSEAAAEADVVKEED